MSRDPSNRPKLALPPRLRTAKGEQRRVGIEIEFANLSARRATTILQAMLGGEIREIGPHEFQLLGTDLGDFRLELDTRFVRKRERAEPYSDTEFDRDLREFIGDVASVVVPCEIVAPPLPFETLPELDRVIDRLIEKGAAGTADNPFYGFGVHLNVEAAELTAEYLRDTLQAYLLMSDWLREQIRIDSTRWVLGYADSFPRSYAALVLDDAYNPDLSALIDDYLRFNPTRNRELDMLPLFAHLDPDRITAAIREKGVRARPAFHYRLPNAQLDDPEWGMVTEWNRWVAVERLADDRRRLRRMAEAYRKNRASLFPRDWARETQRWLSA